MTVKVLSGGDGLKAKLAELAAKLNKATTLSVGFLEGSTEQNGASTPLVAYVQEFGAPSRGIPPRPFFRPMIAEKSPTWGDAVAQNLVATNYDVDATLNRVGDGIAGQLRDSITAVDSPPLSPVTLMVRQIVGPNGIQTFKDVLEARRRVKAGEVATGVSTKPLIWTGDMRKSVSYIVK